MTILHRCDASGAASTWCGHRWVLGSGHDQTWWSITDDQFKGTTPCEKCLDMGGGYLPTNHVKPTIVHWGFNAICGRRPVPYEYISTSSPLTPEYLASVKFRKNLVPCHHCVAVGNGGSAVKAARLDDGFNGNCPRCQMRTYTGATPAGFEHQGGRCPKL